MPIIILTSHATANTTNIIVNFAKNGAYACTVEAEKKNVKNVQRTPSRVPESGGVNSSSVPVVVVTVAVGSAVVISVPTAHTDTVNAITRHRTAQITPTIDLIRFNVTSLILFNYFHVLFKFLRGLIRGARNKLIVYSPADLIIELDLFNDIDESQHKQCNNYHCYWYCKNKC